ncbi:hypothetical protein T4A_762 [Trichinella pseudospiralis]|uniref:Uncharacterized protein n=1 Tax=Trichinella pseudospiralis TaxID=6337 RepID=A0A0V1K8B5_TRIPS|nr:hypothetical protein T4A_762 [Trichinella pseudospiralis]KRZ43460.1 hypothetical protein T4C_1396 [Trichinella pseudospiralis]
MNRKIEIVVKKCCCVYVCGLVERQAGWLAGCLVVGWLIGRLVGRRSGIGASTVVLKWREIWMRGRDGPTDLARRADKPEASDQNEPVRRLGRRGAVTRRSTETANQ